MQIFMRFYEGQLKQQMLNTLLISDMVFNTLDILKILWKMEHLFQKSKCSIFHYIFKYIILKALYGVSKELIL